MNSNPFSLKGQIALVTGASSGIGRGIASGLARAGAKTVLSARRMDRLADLASAIKEAGGDALAVTMDVTDKGQVESAFDQAEAQFGPVSVLINNAGVGYPKPFLQTDDAHLEFTMETNFKGVWNVAQTGARRMVDSRTRGSIINVASVLSVGCKPNNTAYCASKGAVAHLTRAMALDLGPLGIRVNALAPGWFVTELSKDFLETDEGKAYLKRTPAGRAGQIEEMVGPAIMLASSASSFINGVVLPIDGAHSVAVI